MLQAVEFLNVWYGTFNFDMIQHTSNFSCTNIKKKCEVKESTRKWYYFSIFPILSTSVNPSYILNNSRKVKIINQINAGYVIIKKKKDFSLPTNEIPCPIEQKRYFSLLYICLRHVHAWFEVTINNWVPPNNLKKIMTS